jgi:hypothetical protein
MFSAIITWSLPVADPAGIDAALISNPDIRAIAVVLKIFIVTPFRNSLIFPSSVVVVRTY